MAEWGKIYGSLHGSPKWRRASKPARALWATALSWCIDQESSDGLVPDDMLRVLGGTRSEANQLVSVGLWVQTQSDSSGNSDGFCFHDWLDYQRSREEIERTRESDRERKRRSRASNGSTSRRDSDRSHATLSRQESAKSPTVEESRGEESRETPPTPSPDDAAFDAFWKAYPKKVDKGAARKAWVKALRSADSASIIAAAASYAAHPDTQRDGGKFIKNPATWLNAESWGNELRPVAKRAAADDWMNQ